MKKIDLILLHIPLLGLMYMLTLLGIRGDKVEKPTYEQSKLPILIQIVSLITLTLVAYIYN